MTLKFTCPQGHTITCEESFSGKPAKCPQCSTKFIVPKPGEAKARPLRAGDSAKAKAAAAEGKESANGQSGGSSPAAASQRTKKDIIQFLCPNGHKLNGPSRLQGKPGQCPECGAKFRIPSYEDESEDQAPADGAAPPQEEEILTGEVVEDDAVFDAGDLEEIEMVEQADFAVFDATLGEDGAEGYEFEYHESANPPDLAEDFVPTLPDYVEGSHALCGIFSMLWQQRAAGGVIEMQLGEGELLTPDFFSPELSKGTHGVFAMRGKDGVYTITSVAWDSVLRVSLRKTTELPAGLFQE